MSIKISSYKNQSTLLGAILTFIIGAILFTSAQRLVTTIFRTIGIIIAVTAVLEFVIFFFSLRKEEPRKGSLIYSIVALIIAFLFIFASGIIEQFIRFIIGAWILFTGIMRLISALSLNKKNTKFLPMIIVSLLLVAVGIYTILIGDIILSTVGLIMMIFSTIETIGYIFYTKDTQEKEEEGTTSLIIPENTEVDKPNKKKKKIKDVE